MKVLLAILHADPARGGAERYTVDLADALARRGIDAAIAATSFADDLDAPRRRPLESVGVTRTGRYRRFCGALASRVAAERFDIVHAMLPVPACDVYHPHAGLAAAEIRHKPLQAMLNPRRLAHARVERSLLTGAAVPVVLCLSEYVKTQVRRHYPLPDDRLATLFNAVDLDRFPPLATSLPSDRGEVRAVIVAQDFARKGLRFAIEALARVDDPRLVLHVVGRDDPRPYRALARRLGVAGRVRFDGPRSDMPSVYAASDFLVLPTRHDPCSLVVLEALASGLPVLSTRANGACEIMTDGVHGRVLGRADDVPALADAMRAMLDPAARAAARDACLSLRPALSYERHLDDLLAIYARVIVSRRSR